MTGRRDEPPRSPRSLPGRAPAKAETLSRQRLSSQKGRGPTSRGIAQAGALSVGVPEAPDVELAEATGGAKFRDQSASTGRVLAGLTGVWEGERAHGLAGQPASRGSKDGTNWI